MIIVLLQKCTNSTLMVLQAGRTGSLLLDKVTTQVSALAAMSEIKKESLVNVLQNNELRLNIDYCNKD